jgi:hypothetical protein
MAELPRLSDVLEAMIESHPAERIYPADLMDALHDRAIGAMLLLFALVNLLPLPPGASAITGVPLVIVAAQMVIGRERPWLPGWIMRRSVTREQAATGVRHLKKYERWLGKVTKPRFPALTSHTAARAIGLVSLILGIIICLPIPLGNHAPALAITLYGMALVNRDGITAIIGGLVTIGAVVLVSGVIFAAITAVRYFLSHLLESGGV